jgi:hypothetical protein
MPGASDMMRPGGSAASAAETHRVMPHMTNMMMQNFFTVLLTTRDDSATHG